MHTTWDATFMQVYAVRAHKTDVGVHWRWQMNGMNTQTPRLMTSSI